MHTVLFLCPHAQNRSFSRKRTEQTLNGMQHDAQNEKWCIEIPTQNYLKVSAHRWNLSLLQTQYLKPGRLKSGF